MQLLQEGIIHIDDLAVDKFINVIDNITYYSASEKQDGANLWVGVEGGKLFTSREGKHKASDRKFSVDQWENISPNDQFKAAHLALAKVETQIKKILSDNDVIEIEVIFGPQPNVVVYSDSGDSYIVFLRAVDNTDSSKVGKLQAELQNNSVDVSLKIRTSSDGKSVGEQDTQTKFHFTIPKKYDLSLISKDADFQNSVAKFKQFLSQPSEVEGMSNQELANKKATPEISSKKDQLLLKIEVFKDEIKDVVLNFFKTDSNNIYREGIVISNDHEMIKFVDKTKFSKVNEFYQKQRKMVLSAISSTDDDQPIEKRGGIVGNMKIRIAALLGNKDLARNQSFRSELSKAGSVTAFIDTLSINDFMTTKRKVLAILLNCFSLIDAQLQEFKSNNGGELDIAGNKIKYSDAVVKRTLTAFAESRSEVSRIYEKVKSSNNKVELVYALYDKLLPVNTNEVNEQREKIMISYFLLEDESPTPSQPPSTTAGDVASLPKTLNGGKYKIIKRVRNPKCVDPVDSKLKDPKKVGDANV